MAIPSLDTIANGMEVAMVGLFIWMHKRNMDEVKDQIKTVKEKLDEMCLSITKLWTEHNIYKGLHHSHKEDDR